jgi:hypothetical protein
MKKVYTFTPVGSIDNIIDETTIEKKINEISFDHIKFLFKSE